MFGTPQFTDGIPPVREPKKARANTIVALLWFVSIGVCAFAFTRTLVTVPDALQLLAFIVAVVAVGLKLFQRRLGFDGWTAFLFGFFGLVPGLLAILLVLNLAAGPVEEMRVKAVGIRSDQGEDLVLVLQGNAFDQYSAVMLTVPRRTEFRSVREVHYTIRHGIIGYDVLLDRELVIVPAWRLPEVRSE